MSDQILPKLELPFRKVNVGGTELTIKSLTRGQVHQMSGLDTHNLTAVEATCLAFAIGCTVEEAAAWLNEAPADVATKLMDEIYDLAGMGDSGKAPSED